MAGSFGSSSDDEMIASINITPLVDVVLVLLIIFLITAPVIYQSAIKVQLPKATSGEQAEKQSPLNFTVSKEGDVVWNKTKMDWDTLAKELAKIKDASPDQAATINADQAVPHGTVVRLMDLLRQSGISKFALSVEALSGNSSPAGGGASR